MIKVSLSATLVAASVFISFFAAPAFADAEQCKQLFIERNGVYANKNYCFKTSTAKILMYGGQNPSDCRRSVKLTRAEQQLVQQIKREERALGCL